MTHGNAKVDTYIKSQKHWKEEIKLLRKIALECGLQEEMKWRLPCYMDSNKNIAIIQSFKEFCALMFFEGHLLKDSKQLLKAPGENSQTARRLEFSSVSEVSKLESSIKKLLKQAIALKHKPVEKVKKGVKTRAIPLEFETRLKDNKKLKAAFEELTPGRQRQYLIYFSSAKQSETRAARIKKYEQKILKGLGFSD